MRVAPVVLLLSLALVIAACGGEEEVEVVSAAAEKTEAAGAVKVRMTMSRPGGEEGGRSVAEGVVDVAADRSRITLSVDGVPGATEFEQLSLGRKLYVKMPQMPGGRPWIRMDVPEMPGVGRVGGFGMGGDPGAIVAALRDGREVTRVGEEDVDGRRTTRYRMMLDLGVSFAPGEKLSERQQDALRFPAEVWIDEAGLPRRQVMRIDGAEIRTDFLEYGVQADWTPPPADQVSEAPLDAGAISGSPGDSVHPEIAVIP